MWQPDLDGATRTASTAAHYLVEEQLLLPPDTLWRGPAFDRPTADPDMLHNSACWATCFS